MLRGSRFSRGVGQDVTHDPGAQPQQHQGHREGPADGQEEGQDEEQHAGDLEDEASLLVQALPRGVGRPGVDDADHRVGFHVLEVVAEPDEQPQRHIGHERARREVVERAHRRWQQHEGLRDEQEDGWERDDVEDGVLGLMPAHVDERGDKKQTEESKVYLKKKFPRAE